MAARMLSQSVHIPQHESFDIGVKALIVKDGHLLLLKRRDHGVWEMPGGRINRGETIENALLRELSEELPGGRALQVSRIVHAQQTDFTLPNGNHLMLLFFEVIGRIPQEVALSPEHEDSTWVSAAGLSQLRLQPQVHQAALLALRSHTS
jgi:8-oxo-dGTP pyrophosphatase MutT (NUDIX family)